MSQLSPDSGKLPIALPKGVFYGWVIVAVTGLSNFIGATMNPVVFSMFIDPMREDLGVSLGTMAWAITLSQVCSGLSAPIMGRLIDAYGTRWIGAITAFICGAALISLYFADNIWIMYARFAITGLTGLGTFGGNLIAIIPPTSWFVAKRGMASAVSNAGGGLGTAVWTAASVALIATVGWRNTWVIYGILTWVVVVPAFAIFMRRRPEDLGLHPDGALTPPDGVGAVAGRPLAGGHIEREWEAKDALRSPVLWGIVGAATVYAFATSAILFLRVPFWNQLEIPKAAIAIAVPLDPLTVLVCGLVFGYLGDRYAPRFLGVIGGVTRAVSMLPMLIEPGRVLSVFLHNISWGVGSAGFFTAQNLMIPAYFGRRSQGVIRGATVPLNIAAGAMGAPLAGYLVDGGLSMNVVWMAAFVLMLVPGLALVFLKPPQHPDFR